MYVYAHDYNVLKLIGQTFLDLTFGAGGHTRRILDSCDGVNVIGLDRDPVAFSFAKELQRSVGSRFTPLLGRFSELPKLLLENNITSGSMHI